MTDVNQSAIRSYRAGGWYAIFGEHASVLLPQSEKPRVGGLWELVDGGAGFDELLDALIATGLRTLPGFVLVSTAEDPTRIVLRGDARASVVLEGGEVVEVDGGAAATWVERAVSDVKSLQLFLEESEEAVDYQILGGLVRVSRVDQPPCAEPVADPVVEEAAEVTGVAAGSTYAAAGVDAGAEQAQDPEPTAEEVAAEAPTRMQPRADAPVALAGVPDDELADAEGAGEVLDDESDHAVAEDLAVQAPGSGGAEAAPDEDPEATVVDLPPVGDDGPGSSADASDQELPGQDPAAPAWGQHAAVAPTGWGDAPASVASGESSTAEPEWGQPADQSTAGPQWGQPGAEAPAEPVWGAQTDTPAEEPAPAPPSNPFAPGAANIDPPVWEPPAPPETPAWGAAAAPVAPAWGGDPSSPEDQDHDGNTMAGPVNPDQFARQHPGIPGQPQAPSVTSQPVAKLVFSNGETVEVDRAVLIGRAPEARRFTSTEQPRLVTVTSPNSEISSTHLEVRPGSGADHGSAIVTDMGSTNGTVLTQPGFSPEDLQPGIAVQLLPGAVVDLGDGVTIQVTNP